MCGIAGIFAFHGGLPEREHLAAMIGTLQHRGPDAGGIEVHGPAGLGHRRLSIIDLEGGAQPMWAADRAALLSFNGELFNYLELRSELEMQGAVFRTASDTEVVLAACRIWGPRVALPRFNGQYAFAYYEAAPRRLFLARDAMGEKPLYFCRRPEAFIFASEVKAVAAYLRLAAAPLALAPEALSAFLALNYLPGPETFLDGVQALAPGIVLTVEDGRISGESFLSETAVPRDAAGPAAQLGALLDRAARLRTRSDVPLGLFLSGGLDSTAVAAALHAATARPTAFIAHFRERSFSEAERAVQVCRRLDLPFHVVEVRLESENIPELIQKLVWHADQPLADSSALPVYLLSRETARSVKVVLSGDGADELFAGYLTYPATLLARRLPPAVRRVLAGCQRAARVLPASNRKVSLTEKLDRFLRNAALPPGAAHFAWNGMFDVDEKRALLHPDICARISDSAAFNTFAQLCSAHGIDPLRPALQQLLVADQATYLAGDILSKVDRMSMAHGLEVRPVFMDPAIVQFARGLPPELLMRHGRGKLILRSLLAARAPWYRPGPKRGFSIPVHRWFRTLLHEFAADLFHSRFTAESGLYRQDYLLKLWQQHQRRERNLGFELWGVMVSLLWCRQFGVHTASAP